MNLTIRFAKARNRVRASRVGQGVDVAFGFLVQRRKTEERSCVELPLLRHDRAVDAHGGGVVANEIVFNPSAPFEP